MIAGTAAGDRGPVWGRTAARAAWSVLALSICLATMAGGLGLARGPVTGVAAFTAAELVVYLAFLAWVAVGTVIVTRQPGNRVGWILCAAGTVVLLSGFAAEYAVSALLGGWSTLPAGRALAWVASWTTVLGLGLFFYLLLLFPDGHLPSPRWRWVAWLYGAGMAAGIVALALRPGVFAPSLRDLGPIRNPLGLTAAAPVLGLVDAISRLIVTVLYLAAVGSLLVRLRRSRGIERQQLKWVAYAGGMLIGFLLLVNLLEGRRVPLAVQLAVEIGFFVLGVLGVPTAVAVAILRYRLYDIDRLINRTLVYGLLTALLGGVYAGAVLVLGQLFGRVGGEPPTWAVAGATLTVAALFQPARRRIQVVVDRRFDRRRYDMATTVETFSVRLRDELDLDMLSAELLAVVDQTVQPAKASLWLRPPTQRSHRSEGQGSLSA
jgi:hypothetical protein